MLLLLGFLYKTAIGVDLHDKDHDLARQRMSRGYELLLGYHVAP